jgi:hypothetical protein
VAAGLAGSAWVTVLSSINVTVQMAAPHAVVGRCLALYHMHAFGGLAIGSLLWGSVAEGSSVATALLASAAALCISLILSIPLPLPGIVSLETEEALA